MSYLPYPKFKAFDPATGEFLTGGLLHTFRPGTDTQKPAYTDKDLSVPAENPIELDTVGEAAVYLKGAYRLELRSADNSTLLWTMDNATGVGPGDMVWKYLSDFDGDLAQMVADIGDDPANVIVDCSATVSSDIEIPKNIFLQFPPSPEVLTVQNGAELTINRMGAEAGHIFECVSDGKVTLKDGSCKEAFVAWWGASPARSPEENTDRINRALLCGIPSAPSALLKFVTPGVRKVSLTEDLLCAPGVRLGVDGLGLRLLRFDLNGHTLDFTGTWDPGVAVDFLGGGSNPVVNQFCSIGNGKLKGDLVLSEAGWIDDDSHLSGLRVKSCKYCSADHLTIEGFKVGLDLENTRVGAGGGSPATWDNDFSDFTILYAVSSDRSGRAVRVGFNVNGTGLDRFNITFTNRFLQVGDTLLEDQEWGDIPSGTFLSDWKCEDAGFIGLNGKGMYLNGSGIAIDRIRWEDHKQSSDIYVGKDASGVVIPGIERSLSCHVVVDSENKNYVGRTDFRGMQSYNRPHKIMRRNTGAVLVAGEGRDGSHGSDIVAATVASPGVFTLEGHGFVTGKIVTLSGSYAPKWKDLCNKGYYAQRLSDDTFGLKDRLGVDVSTVGFSAYRADDPPIESMSRARRCVIGLTNHGLTEDATAKVFNITQPGWDALNDVPLPVFEVIDANYFSVDIDTRDMPDEYDPATDNGKFNLNLRVSAGPLDKFSLLSSGAMTWSDGMSITPDGYLDQVAPGIFRIKAGAFNGVQRPTSDGSGNLAIDLTQGLQVLHTLSQNTTIANPTFGTPPIPGLAPVSGMTFKMTLKWPATAHTLAFGAAYTLVGGSISVPSTNTKRLVLEFLYDDADSKWILQRKLSD